MSELKGIYALWYRETKVFLRERSRVVSSIINPLLWLLIIGGGLGSVVSFGGAELSDVHFSRGSYTNRIVFIGVFWRVHRLG